MRGSEVVTDAYWLCCYYKKHPQPVRFDFSAIKRNMTLFVSITFLPELITLRPPNKFLCRFHQPCWASNSLTLIVVTLSADFHPSLWCFDRTYFVITPVDYASFLLWNIISDCRRASYR